ncbi:hypothetical protein D3C81_1413110 [compost metagenome]
MSHRGQAAQGTNDIAEHTPRQVQRAKGAEYGTEEDAGQAAEQEAHQAATLPCQFDMTNLLALM